MVLNHSLLSIAILLVLCQNSPTIAAQPADATMASVLHDAGSADQTAISMILTEQDNAWAVGDADRYTARALPNIVFTNVVGAYSVGKDPLLIQVRKIFSTIYKGSRVKTTLVGISMIGDDVAIVDTITKLTGFSEPAVASAMVGGATYSRLQETMVKRNGGWWIASIHNVFIIPPLVPKDELNK